MFFIASKIFWLLGRPLTLISLCLLGSLFTIKFKWGRQILVSFVSLFLFFGFVPAGPWAIQYLESRVEVPSLPEHIKGVIILGGAINAEDSVLHNQLQINELAERFTEMVKLSHAYPQARVIYSGGSGSIMGQEYREADQVRRMLLEMGVPVKNFVAENKSRNTYENCINSKILASPQAGENWVLVTSAFHMYRSMKVFEKAGWKVIPYPAGYLENNNIKIWEWLDVSGNYWKLNVAAKELIGIIAYHLSGKI